MVKVACTPKFKKTDSYLEKLQEIFNKGLLNKYGEKGVIALSNATPKDTGKTAESWYYTISRSGNTVSITWSNNNFNNGVPIAIVLQYGHATRDGGFVKGRDYINPAIQPVFDEIAKEAWKEVHKS